MDEYVEVKIDVFEHTGQRTKILRNLTISGLMDEIFKEFDDIPSESSTKYAVYLKGTPKPLRSNATITELDLQPQDELIFEYRHQNIREPLLPQDYAFLTDDITGRKYDIQWQPALIGRPTAEADHNLMLAVNVELLPKGMTISRKHAQITYSDEKYFIESLAENNPVFVNRSEMPTGAMWEIKNGDRLTFGRYDVTLNFITLPHTSKPEVKEVKPQPAPTPKPQSTPSPRPAQAAPAAVPVASQPAAQPAQPGETSMEPGGTALDLGASRYSFLIIEKATLQGVVGQRIDMTAYPFIIGRTLPTLNVEKGVSRQHAEINFEPLTGKFTFKDLGSTNGSKIEGIEAQAQVAYELSKGHHISLGQDVVVRFEM